MQTVHDNPAESEFDMYIDGEIAGWVRYRVEGSEIWMLYTAVTRGFHDRGLTDPLIQTALDDAHRRRIGVLPFCPLVRQYMRLHPQYLGLIPVGRSALFRPRRQTDAAAC
jgi:uncharacterized protein